MKVVVLAQLRGDGPWLLEWLAHLAEVGFIAVWVCAVDAETDGTAALLTRLEQRGSVRWLRDAPADPHAAVEWLRAAAAADGIDWVLALAPDEFPVLPAGIDLTDVLAGHHAATVVALDATVFGWDRQVRRRPGLVGERFRACAPEPERAARWLVRPAAVRFTVGQPRATDGTVVHTTPANGVLRLNRYPTRSVDELVGRLLRHHPGLAASPADPWPAIPLLAAALHGGAVDDAIDRHLPAVATRLATLLADPALAAAQQQVMDAQRALLATPAAQALVAQLVDSLCGGLRGGFTVVDGELRGWVCHPPQRPAGPCVVLVDRAQVAELVADQPCDLLPADWIGDTRVGFRVPLPTRLCDGRPRLVTVLALDEDRLGGTCTALVPFPLPPPPPLRHHGSIDAVVEGQVVGWLSTLDFAQVPRCWISVDGGPGHATVPDRERADLQRLYTEGRLGFLVLLPDALLDDRRHRIEVAVDLDDGRRQVVLGRDLVLARRPGA